MFTTVRLTSSLLFSPLFSHPLYSPLLTSVSPQNKKSRETSVGTSSNLSASQDTTDDSSQGDKMVPIPDYEELLDPNTPPHQKPFQSSGQKAVPNDYVPSPPEMEPFRGRVYTIGVCQPTHTNVPLRRHQEPVPQRDSGATGSEDDTRSTSSSQQQSHHLSLISMESGLSFGYDVEVNSSLPLEAQPWFHGKLPRTEAEGLLHDDGDFLVRENTILPDTYTLSMCWQGFFDHTLIQCVGVVSNSSGTTVKYSFDSGAFDSIPELICNHLKYQIPISKEAQSILITPVHRAGTKATVHQLMPAEGNLEDRSSRYLSKRTSSPDTHRLHPVRSLSVSSSHSASPRMSPSRDHLIRMSNSSDDLLDSREVSRLDIVRNTISPPPTSAAPVMRPRAMSESHATSLRQHGHQKRDSFGDYEVMESVSLLGSPTAQRKDYSSPSPAAPSSFSSSKEVKYAEIQHTRRQARPSSFAGAHTVTTATAPASGIKYAEVRFMRRQQHHPNSAPPSSSHLLYDTITSSTTAKASPYQSRAEVLAQKLSEPTYATPRGTNQRLSRMESSPHPFARHHHNVPRQVSSPLAMAGISEEGASPPIAQRDPKLFPLKRADFRPNLVHPEPAPSRPAEQYSSQPRQPTQPSQGGGGSKVPTTLPGRELLMKLQDTLSTHSEEELAYHLTRADAVVFLLSPRPGEDKEVWKER